MKLTSDLKSAKLIYLKGFLFLVTSLLSVTVLLFKGPTLRTAFLLGIAFWSFCSQQAKVRLRKIFLQSS